MSAPGQLPAKYDPAAVEAKWRALWDERRTYAFDPDSHATLADVTADQLATGNGYSQDSKTLVNQILSEDDSNNRAVMIADAVTFIASGGNIGPTGSAIFYDASTPDDTIIMCADFGQDHTIIDGKGLQLTPIEIGET